MLLPKTDTSTTEKSEGEREEDGNRKQKEMLNGVVGRAFWVPKTTHGDSVLVCTLVCTSGQSVKNHSSFSKLLSVLCLQNHSRGSKP